MLDAVRLGPADDATAVTADQLRAVVDRLITAGHHLPGDPDILIVADAGYDITRLAYVLGDLPVELLGRIRADRVLRLPKPPRTDGTNGRPPKHGREFDRAATASGIGAIRTPDRAPRANAVCERFLGSVRRACVDHTP